MRSLITIILLAICLTGCDVYRGGGDSVLSGGMKIDGPLTQAINTAACGSSMSIDGSKNLYSCEQTAGNINVSAINIAEGQQVTLSIKNESAVSPIALTFPSGLYWRDGVTFLSVDATEVNIYTFVKVGDRIAVACMTDLQQVN